MEFTEQDKLNLARFGCTLQLDENRICIVLSDVDRERACAARVCMKAAYTKCTTGPLLCLVLEISPTRALPRYFYFPFDLNNPLHDQFLTKAIETERLHLIFLEAGYHVLREHEVTITKPMRIKQFRDEAVSNLTDNSKYDFADAVQEFERSIRVPHFFEHVISDGEMPKIISEIRNAAEKVPIERRTLARQICLAFSEVLKNRLGTPTNDQVAMLDTVRAGLLTFRDFESEFGADYDRFAEFMADAIALNVKDDAVLRRFIDWPPKLDAALAFLEQISPAVEADQNGVRTNLMDTLTETLGDVAGGRELSLRMLQSLFLPLRPLLTAQAGRPTKDYSKEYEWKHTLSWTNVARKSLQENPEIREEFGGRDFDSLGFEQQESLKKRIIEGVRSWAQRNGKQFPIGKQ